MTMTNENDVPQTRISKQDVDGVASKLEQFMDSLPEQERNVLGWILTRANAASEQDTAGYLGSVSSALVPGFNTPIASQLALASGFGNRLAAGTTEVTWAYKSKDMGGFGRYMYLR